MVENRSGEPFDPTPNYDCHISKMASVDLSSTSPQYAFESNQVRIEPNVFGKFVTPG